ncbi:DUF4912 domain-containing protein [Blastopirellula marina]|uniref:DUF4912 domain-containing protein n=1 Tax=Blastopirellula marina TaxID=124 RepID=A0A2S8FAU2_9BACT|nr:DUF4912 domain-containing protein [Blastopirellula marina]RCS50445.1 DUF4912 domain-containing protein [Bremerella cremea]
MTAASLKEYTAKDLAQMAKRRGVTGWHAMRKDELVKALIKAAKSSGTAAKSKSTAKPKKAKAAPAKPAPTVAKKPPVAKAKPAATAKRRPAKAKPEKKSDPKVVESIRTMYQQRQAAKDLGTSSADQKGADRLVLMVRDSYWMHACWEVSRKAIDRAKAALAQDWHTSTPMLRVMEVDGEVMTSGSERLVKQIEIHGGVKNWYIDVADPPKSYRCHLGYLATNGRFHAIARSNVVTTPRPGSCEEIDGNWDDVADNVEKIYALSGGADEEHADGELREMLEQRFRRPVGMPMAARLGLVGDQFCNGKPNQDFDLNIEVEMIVCGSTKAGSYVTLSGEPVKVREDGTFMVKMDFPDKRQIFPIVARSKDGLEQRTIALAVERNTKAMDPISHDPRDSNGS